MPRRSLIVENFFLEIWEKLSERDKRVVFPALLANSACSLEFLDYIKPISDLDNIELDHLGQNSNIPVEFFQQNIEKFGKEFVYHGLMDNKNVPLDFFIENRDVLEDFPHECVRLFKREDCPWSFVEEFFEGSPDWKMSNPHVPVEFVENFIRERQYFPVAYLSNPNVSMEILSKYKTLLTTDHLTILAKNPHAPLSFFNEIGNKLTSRMTLELYNHNLALPWSSIDNPTSHQIMNLFLNPTVPRWFVERHMRVDGKIQQRYLSLLIYNNALPEEFFEDHYAEFVALNNVYFGSLAGNSALSLKFFERHPEIPGIFSSMFLRNTFDHQFKLEADQRAIEDARVALIDEPSDSLALLMLGVLQEEEELQQRNRSKIQYQ